MLLVKRTVHERCSPGVYVRDWKPWVSRHGMAGR
jgi:hypothetical protein